MKPQVAKTNCRIRAARPGDYLAIGVLAGQSLQRFGDYRNYLPRWARIPAVVTLVADQADSLLGFLMVTIFQRRQPQPFRYADILAVAVAPAGQGRGIGSQLLDTTISLLIEQRDQLQISEVQLTVADSNRDAQRLFQRFGFQFTGELEGFYESGQRALKMRRKI